MSSSTSSEPPPALRPPEGAGDHGELSRAAARVARHGVVHDSRQGDAMRNSSSRIPCPGTAERQLRQRSRRRSYHLDVCTSITRRPRRKPSLRGAQPTSKIPRSEGLAIEEQSTIARAGRDARSGTRRRCSLGSSSSSCRRWCTWVIQELPQMPQPHETHNTRQAKSTQGRPRRLVGGCRPRADIKHAK